MKKHFELTDDELSRLYKAATPVPYIVVGGVIPSSPQERANAVWEELGKERGFKPFTVEPSGEGDKFFLAEEAENKEVLEHL